MRIEMRFIGVILITAAVFFWSNASVMAVIPSCTQPFTTIEQAVICSGGTYGVIDTSNPDSVNNFVDTIFDNGLTAVDDGSDCTSMNIRPSVKFSCKLSVNKDAYYYYQGQKGEKITVIVSAKTFLPRAEVFDANGEGESLDINNGTDEKYLTVTRTLPYTGQYTIRITSKGNTYTQPEEENSFTIILTSDKTNIQPDIRKDNLIEGKKYSVYELNQNQSTTSRKFLVDAQILYIYKVPPCPREVGISCPLSQSPHITIDDDCMTAKIVDTCRGATLWFGGDKQYDFKIGSQYCFEVSVQNTSKTNIPQNRFTLIKVIGEDGGKDTEIMKDNVDPQPIMEESFLVRLIDLIKNLLK
jgi:hypothetical protein